MAVFRWEWEQPAPVPCRGAAVSIGNFDGVHRGHAELVAALRRLAEEQRVPAVAVTFDPSPLSLLRPDLPPLPLTTVEDRCRLLHAAGAIHVLILHTKASLLCLEADAFFRDVLLDRLAVRGMVEGPNFAFGHNRGGDVETLTRFCGQAGVPLGVVSPVPLDGGIVSSSVVRRALLAGDATKAAHGLGRPYHLTGAVEVGARRGRNLGFPTANVAHVPTLIPGDGVYAVEVDAGDAVWPGAANVGPNPTFGEHARKLEVHLIGFSGDLYGQSVTVRFLKRLRDTQRFASVDALQRQLQMDVRQAASAVAAWRQKEKSNGPG